MTPEPQSNATGSDRTLVQRYDDLVAHHKRCIDANVEREAALRAELKQAKRDRDHSIEVRVTALTTEINSARTALADLTRQRDEARYDANRFESQRNKVLSKLDAAQAQADALRIERDELQAYVRKLADRLADRTRVLRLRVAELEAALRQWLSVAERFADYCHTQTPFSTRPENAGMLAGLRKTITKASAALAATPQREEPRHDAPAQVTAPDEPAQARPHDDDLDDVINPDDQ